MVHLILGTILGMIRKLNEKLKVNRQYGSVAHLPMELDKLCPHGMLSYFRHSRLAHVGVSKSSGQLT